MSKSQYAISLRDAALFALLFLFVFLNF